MEAHQDLMQHLRERLKIKDEAALEKLRQEVCPEEKDAKGPSKAENTTARPAANISESHNATIEKFVEKMQETINNTEPDFKSLKADVKKWEAKKGNLEQAIQKMRENDRPEADINKKTAELEDVKEKLKTQWILRYRQEVLDPTKFRESKILLNIFSRESASTV